MRSLVALRRLTAGLIVSLLAVALVGPTGEASSSAGDVVRRTTPEVSAEPPPPAWTRRLPDTTTQVVRTISSDYWCTQVYCTVTQAWHKDKNGAWSIVRHFRSTIGTRGWGKTREGDMRSPNGVRRIKVTFSTGSSAPGRMPWKPRLPTSTVTNAPGRLYNTWIEERGRTDGDRPSMRYGFVVNYNRVRLHRYVGPKPVQGKGSGIFYHTSRPGHRWAPTEGCTQVGNVAGMRWLVEWLRPGARPRIVQNL